MKKYLLDTDTCIYIIKKRPAWVFKKFQTLSLGQVCISSVTLAELEYGVKKSQAKKRNQQALEAFILPLSVMPFDKQAASYYGEIRAMLEQKGTPIGPLDFMIAAHALSLNMTLVTNNVREFARIGYLMIENWAKEDV
jgi:tRNA(fMet)-specific endonuclease VapC